MKRRFFAFDTPIEVFNNLPSSVLFYWKNEQSIHYGCNDRMAEITGFKATEIAGTTAYEFMQSEEADIIVANDQQVLKKQVMQSFIEVCCFRTQKEAFTELSIKTVLRNSAHQIKGTFGISLILNDPYLLESANSLKKINFLGKDSMPLLFLPTKYQAELTPKERQCVYHLVKGKTVKEIANALKISGRTVETHLTQIKQKLGCYTRAQIIDKVFNEGLIS